MDLTPNLARSLERLLIVANVPVLLLIGYKLFLAGATANTSFMIESKTWKGKVVRLSPGVACFVVAGVLAWTSLNTGQVTTQDGNGASTVSNLSPEPSVSLGESLREAFLAVAARATNGTDQTATECRAILHSYLKATPSAQDWRIITQLEADPRAAPQTLKRYRDQYLLAEGGIK